MRMMAIRRVGVIFGVGCLLLATVVTAADTEKFESASTVDEVRRQIERLPKDASWWTVNGKDMAWNNRNLNRIFPTLNVHAAGPVQELEYRPMPEIAGFEVRASDVPHKGGRTFGFRVSDGASSLAYIPDYWLAAATEEPADLIDGAGLLLHDSQHTAAEMEEKAFLGHSSVEYTIDLADRHDVERLAFFHHDPRRTDEEIDQIAKDANAASLATGLRRTLGGLFPAAGTHGTDYIKSKYQLVEGMEARAATAAGTEHVAIGEPTAGYQPLEISQVAAAGEEIAHVNIAGGKTGALERSRHFHVTVDALFPQDGDTGAGPGSYEGGADIPSRIKAEAHR